MIKKDSLYFPEEKFRKTCQINDEKVYQEAKKDPIKFWEKAAQDIFWRKKWQTAYEYKNHHLEWFLGGQLNITETILDKAKNKNKPAIIWEPESAEESARIFTYGQLLLEVNKFANGLLRLGIKKGDIVAIYMPMVPETIVAMLACARIGAVHAVIFSAFSAEALKYRLENLGTKVLISCDGYYRRGQIINLKPSVDAATTGTGVEKIVMIRRAKNEIAWDKAKNFWYDELIENESDKLSAEIMDSEDLLFVLPESGTSGQFLPVMHSCGGYATYAKWSGKAVFDFKETDTLWCMSDAGWITGHTYTIYSPLLNGATTIIYEGAPDWPNPGRWTDIIKKYQVTIFYTSPTALRMFARQDKSIVEKADFEKIRILGSVGEAIDETTWLWYFNNIGRQKCPIVDTWWQTETGGIMITSLPGIGPYRPAYTGRPLPGIKIDIFDEEGKGVSQGKQGNLVILPPFPPAMLRGIYKNEPNYIESYWSRYGENVYFTSDGAFMDENGLVRITGRVDDVLKVAGHRIATGELENAVAKHPDVAEAAVVGVPDEIKGEVPIIFFILKRDRDFNEFKTEIIEQIKKEVGPIVLPKEIYVVGELPKTKSSKTMRLLIKRLYKGEDLGDISALANPSSIEIIKQAIKK